MHPLFRSVQGQLPDLRIGAIRAGKGLDRYILAETGWENELPIRHTVVLLRASNKIEDLGRENWTTISKIQQHRLARPSHVMLCIFATQNQSRATGEEEAETLQNPAVQDTTVRDEGSPVSSIPVNVPTWTPMSASVSGPKYLALSVR